MKIRTNFLSNSSSCSFVIQKDKLYPLQLEQLRNIEATSRWLKASIEKEKDEDGDIINRCLFYPDDFESTWKDKIKETETTIEGYHYMDNFNMPEFFMAVGLPEDSYTLEE